MSELPDRQTIRSEVLAAAAQSRKAEAGPGMLLSDLDSFSVVEMIVTLEDRIGVSLLADLDQFSGTTINDFVDFAADRVKHTDG